MSTPATGTVGRSLKPARLAGSAGDPGLGWRPNDAWTTHVGAIVNPDGTINFNGFFGDYNIGNQPGSRT
jgi:hypothetical protein